MSNALHRVPEPLNEPIRKYLPGSKERESLIQELDRQASTVVNIPLVINGKEVYTENTFDIYMPHDHQHILARCSLAGAAELNLAVESALAAKESWEAMPWEHRIAIFLRAAELVCGPYRDKINASTMLGQSKTFYQSEIDAACELVDFLRFNAYYAEEIFAQQPGNMPGIWNRLTYRALDGFIVAISPFNFTSIASNLGCAPAQLGNTVIWKPSRTSALSNYYYMQILQEAGLPSGVMNFVPSSGSDVSKHLLTQRKMAGIHFTGSTSVFKTIWTHVGENITDYESYPRLVGETGGKDFVFAHNTANPDALVTGLVCGAFEYQGQKCSAASRAYIPESIWPTVKEKLLDEVKLLRVGDIRDFTNFLGAVIDQPSFDNVTAHIERAIASPDAEVLCGGSDGSKGWFVYPTVIQAHKPDYPTMVEELFGPVLTIYVYPDDRLDETLEICDTASQYALAGAIYANDRSAIIKMSHALRNAAGNFYINDKPTGAVVGQQPFGGSRASGTNDKAGSALNLYRWLSVQTIKEALNPVTTVSLPK